MIESSRSTPFELDIWHDPAALKWGSREITRQPLQEVLRQAYSEHISPQDTVVEIGSGVGALTDLLGVPHPTVHIDGSVNMLETHRTSTDKSHAFVNGDLYRLPFADNSVDAVAGILVLDAITDITAAVEEVERVLKPGGTFLYFHDMRASTNGLANIIRSSGEIPVPLTETGRGVESFGLLQPKDVKKLERTLRSFVGRSAASECISLLTDAAPSHFDYWTFDKMNAVESIAIAFRSAFSTDDETPHVSETFLQVLNDIAIELSMEVRELGERQAVGTVSREVAAIHGYEFEDDTNVILQTIHGTQYAHKSDMPDGQILVASIPAIFAATKKRR